MSDEPLVVVQPPDRRGLREVWIRGEPADHVWSVRELRRLLDRSGLSEVGVDGEAVEWRGAGSGVWPDRSALRYATGAVLAAGMLGCMVLLIQVGQVDAFESPSFASRITGILFMVAGGVQGFSALAVLDFAGKRQWPYSGVAVLAGLLIALASNSLFLVMWFQEREYGTPLLPAFAALWAWSVWALWFLLYERTWRDIPHPQGFAIGFIVTTALTAANLAHSSWFQPSVAGVSVQASTRFGKAYLDEDAVYLPLTIKVKNGGNVPAYILGSVFWVMGQKFGPVRADSTEKAWKDDLEAYRDVDLFAKPPVNTMIVAGELLGAGGYINPGGEFVSHRLIQLPRLPHFDRITTRAEVLTLRKDQARIPSGLEENGFSWNPKEGDPEKCEKPPCGGSVRYIGEIEHSNNIINVTRKQRYLNSSWRMEDGWNNSHIQAGVRPRNSAGMLSVDWEGLGHYGIERITGEDDTIVVRFLTNPPKEK
ncbi:hypothetical protein PV721_06445 [Streptomyces sp. MB09-01]|uniref:hypothetical protein n=1 Tax=Streptomyces sp. MB09-01 TaxID=3028666 RepID=UPI0029A9E9B1|nr:hypothetical protein [Streptomyces sp. MB09-01]MDX3534009.1 hypothetical protein [Streptomyces sp. MB09-01]